MAWITSPVLGTGGNAPESSGVIMADAGKLLVVVDEREWFSPLDTTLIVFPYADGYPQ